MNVSGSLKFVWQCVVGQRRWPILMVLLSISAAAVWAPHASADNTKLNKNVIQMVYVVRYKAGCRGDIKINPQLQAAAQAHTLDVLNHYELDGDIGSDGSSPQERAANAGFRGKVAETVAINPALAISSVELINQWYDNPGYLATMQDCANSAIGVWSENSLDRTVVVAVYGQPE